MKRIFDIAFSLIALTIAFPILFAVGLAIWLERTGPIFYRQQRVGFLGIPFQLLKFRSMMVNADREGYSTSKGDSRVTKVGTYIRRWSLDELPQFWNVLRGDMSLVGPRPDVPAQQELYDPKDWDLRCSVKPGITGEAQVRYRSNCNFNQRLEADLEYVKYPWNLLNDLRIVLATFFKIKSW